MSHEHRPCRPDVAIAVLLALLFPGAGHAGPTADSVAIVRELVQSRRYAEAELRSRRWLDEMTPRADTDTARAAALEMVLEVDLAAGNWNGPESKEIGDRAVAAKGRVYGEGSPEAGNCRITFARLLYRAGDWDAARAQAEHGLSLCERAYGTRHRSVMRGLQYLANILEEQAEFEPAEKFYFRAIAVAESLSGPSSADLGNMLNSLAVMYRKTGRLSEARPLYERALAIRERALGPESPELVFNLNNLANLRGQMGDARGAKLLYERDLAILDRTEGTRHPFYAQVLANLASTELELADTTSAISDLERSLRTREAAVGGDHPDLAFALDDLGVIWTATGDTARARLALERALALRTRAYGPGNPEVAKVLQHLGDLALASGAVDSAQARYSRALAIRERSLGHSNRDVAESQIGLAVALRQAGDDPGALELAARGEQTASEHLRLTARVLEERLALEYAATRPSGLDLALSIVADHPRERALVGRAWDALIRSRALVLDEMARRRRVVVSHPDSVTAALADSLEAADELLAWLVASGADTTAASHRRRALAADRKERFEFELAARSAEFRRLERTQGAGLGEVARSLGPGRVLVAFARFSAMPPGSRIGASTRPSANPASLRYLAFVLAGGDSLPRAVVLGTGNEIDTLVAAWYHAASRRPGALNRARDEARCRLLGQALRRSVWDPLAGWCTGAARVFVVPDGALQLVNFAALPGVRRPFLVEEGPAFHELSAERDLVLASEPGPAGRGLLVLGDPDFDHARGAGREPDAQAARAREGHRARGGGANPEGKAGGESTSRAATSGCQDFRALNFGPLPESAHEAGEAAAIWRASTRSHPRGDSAVVTLLGARAGETEFRASAPGRRWLHLATHGFFLGHVCGAPDPPGHGGQGVDTLAHENPLLRSGLALAGANRRGTAAGGSEDGILTADEIAKLDLSGVEWAVLSACETARGDIRASEGVLGLRRGFQIAGARTLVMSLWAVDDEAAHAWIGALYRARLVRGLGAAEAMRAASLEVLGTRRAGGASTHPFYWAGFVATGDWR